MGLLSSINNFFYIAADKIKSAFVRVRDAMARFFEKALSMMKITLEKLKNRIRGAILGASHFFRKVGNKYQEGTKNYTVDEELGEWNEITVTREVSINDVPPKYRVLDDEFEIDDTGELDAAIGC